MSSDGVRLDPGWPGLSVPDGTYEVDPDALEEVAAELEEEAETLRSEGAGGSASQLANNGGLPFGSFGGWGTGAEMQTGYNDAHSAVVRYYGEVISALEQAAALLRATALQHRQGDEVSGAGFEQQFAALADQVGPGSNGVVVA